MIKAIIYKDILENKSFLLWWLFLIMVELIIFIPFSGLTIVTAITPLCSINLILQTIAENNQSGWYSYLLTTSANRKTILNSLYLISLVGTGLILLITLLCSFLLAFLYKIPLLELISNNLLLILWEYCFTIIINSISIYISFKTNTKIARTIITLTFLFSFLLVPFVFALSSSLNTVLEPVYIFTLIIIILTIIIVSLFYKLTLNLLNKKDF